MARLRTLPTDTKWRINDHKDFSKVRKTKKRERQTMRFRIVNK